MTMAYVAVAIAVTSTVASTVQSRKARKAQDKARKVEGRRRAIESRKANIESIEDARQLIGQVTNVSAQTGALGGSGQLGASGSLMSQLGSNITFNQQLLAFSQRQESYLQAAANDQSQAQTFSAIASVALSAAAVFATPKAKVE